VLLRVAREAPHFIAAHAQGFLKRMAQVELGIADASAESRRLQACRWALRACCHGAPAGASARVLLKALLPRTVLSWRRQRQGKAHRKVLTGGA
jgi:hypothetical protein